MEGPARAADQAAQHLEAKHSSEISTANSALHGLEMNAANAKLEILQAQQKMDAAYTALKDRSLIAAVGQGLRKLFNSKYQTARDLYNKEKANKKSAEANHAKVEQGIKDKKLEISFIKQRHKAELQQKKQQAIAEWQKLAANPVYARIKSDLINKRNQRNKITLKIAGLRLLQAVKFGIELTKRVASGVQGLLFRFAGTRQMQGGPRNFGRLILAAVDGVVVSADPRQVDNRDSEDPKKSIIDRIGNRLSRRATAPALQ